MKGPFMVYQRGWFVVSSSDIVTVPDKLPVFLEDVSIRTHDMREEELNLYERAIGIPIDRRLLR